MHIKVWRDSQECQLSLWQNLLRRVLSFSTHDNLYSSCELCLVTLQQSDLLKKAQGPSVYIVCGFTEYKMMHRAWRHELTSQKSTFPKIFGAVHFKSHWVQMHKIFSCQRKMSNNIEIGYERERTEPYMKTRTSTFLSLYLIHADWTNCQKMLHFIRASFEWTVNKSGSDTIPPLLAENRHHQMLCIVVVCQMQVFILYFSAQCYLWCLYSTFIQP